MGESSISPILPGAWFIVPFPMRRQALIVTPVRLCISRAPSDDYQREQGPPP